jgi:hypothetical protein
VAALVLSGRGPLVRWGAATRTAGALDDLTTDVVRAKLEKRGFEVREHTRSHQQGALEFVSFEFARGERKGYVQLYRWVDDEGAARGAQSLPAADHDTAVRRDGAVALVIVDSSGGAEALMASMVE